MRIQFSYVFDADPDMRKSPQHICKTKVQISLHKVESDQHLYHPLFERYTYSLSEIKNRKP